MCLLQSKSVLITFHVCKGHVTYMSTTIEALKVSKKNPGIVIKGSALTIMSDCYGNNLGGTAEV